MRFWFGMVLLLFFASCEDIIDVTRVDGPCTIQLKNGTVITTENSIEILDSTGTITYRDDEDRLWSLTRSEYESYSCGS